MYLPPEPKHGDIGINIAKGCPCRVGNQDVDGLESGVRVGEVELAADAFGV